MATSKAIEALISVIVDAATGEVTQKEMTPEEIAEHEKLQAEAQAFNEQENAKIAARESALAKLKALGLTDQEIGAL